MEDAQYVRIGMPSRVPGDPSMVPVYRGLRAAKPDEALALAAWRAARALAEAGARTGIRRGAGGFTDPQGRWLAFLEPERVAALMRALAPWDPLLKACTLVIEVGALLFLWRRRGAVALAAGWILFHLGAFALTGMFFWSWITLDGVLLFLLVRGDLKALRRR